MTRYRAKLTCDGKSHATTPIEAQDRESATSAAIEWAHGEIAGGHPAPASLFLEIDGHEWAHPAVARSSTAARRADDVARHKELYEALHPETANGAVGNGRTQLRQFGEATPRFTKATADATGQSERAVQRDGAQTCTRFARRSARP